MIDLHCHILHGMDDGAGNLSDAVEMAASAAASGTTAVIATPHCSISDLLSERYCRRYAERFSVLRQEIAARNIPLALYPGHEIFLLPDGAGLLEKAVLSPGYTGAGYTGAGYTGAGQTGAGLNGTRYLLIEFDEYEYAAAALGSLEQLVSAGYIPIVAHPERYRFLREDPSAASRIKRLGGLLQLNRGSLLGRFGTGAQRLAEEIVRKRLADFVASDAHSPYSRTPYLADVHEYLCGTVGSRYAAALLHGNPLAVLSGRELSALPHK